MDRGSHQPSKTEMGSKVFLVNDCIQPQVKALRDDLTDIIVDTEKANDDGFQLIKAGTLSRLVERLTYFYPGKTTIPFFPLLTHRAGWEKKNR